MVTANQVQASQTLPEAMPHKVQRAALSRWKIETLTGLLGLESLEKQTQMSHANQEAENRWAREKVWGQSGEVQPPQAEDESKMGHILGDNIHPTPIVVTSPPTPQQNSILPALALAAATMLPATGAAAGVIGYLLARQPAQPPAQVQPVQPQPQEYEEFNLGLGRLEDFIKEQRQ